MKYLPIDVSSLSNMIQGNYVYVDKTEYIYNLFSGGNRYYFLSRPRRFGKSLLISTLKELFLSNKELFKNLWIYKSDYQWQEHPVIHLDFSNMNYATSQELQKSLAWMLQKTASFYKIDISAAPTLNTQFSYLVEQLAQKNKVVILIDEYDKPILDHLHDLPRAQEMREILRSFYGVIKGIDPYLRAVFLTGVSRFSKTSLFSGLNNLNDISLKPEAAILLGYTQQELQTYFTDYIQALAEQLNLSFVACLDKLQYWYNGYRFSETNEKVYNPFSILYALHDKKLTNYWFESGTSTVLIHLLKQQYGSLENISNMPLARSGLSNFELNDIPLLPLLLQTGYLTISNYDDNQLYVDYPNYEVEESFTKFLVAVLTYRNISIIQQAATQIMRALQENDIEQFCAILTTLFARIPYTIAREDYYHALLQFLLNLLSLEAQSEILTNRGRIDMTLITRERIFLFELKYNASPKVALEQIKKKKYYEQYLGAGKPITLIGLAFNPIGDTVQLEYITQEI